MVRPISINQCFYLHGAIHLLINNNNDTFKVVKNDHPLNMKYLIDDAITKLQGYQNLMVLEGMSNDKLCYINSNAYLKKCLNKLSNQEGILVIYGCSILNNSDQLNNDYHIWNKIINNKKFIKIYIGRHCTDKKLINEKDKIINNFRTLSHDGEIPDITFYSTIESSIWDKIF